VRFSCPAATLSAARIDCADGRLAFRSTVLGAQQLRAGVVWLRDVGRVELHLDGLRLDGGTFALQATLQGERWEARMQGAGLQLAAFSGRLAGAGVLPAPLEGDGQLTLSARLEGTGSRLQQGRLTGRLHAGEFTDAEGNLAGDGLRLEIEADLQQRANGDWRIDAALEGREGQVYAAPVFVDLDTRPIHAQARLDWRPGTQRLDIHALDFRQPAVITLQARGVIDLARAGLIETLALQVEQAVFPGLYETWLQPWLVGTLLADLQTSGEFGARLDWVEGELAEARLALAALSLDDRGGRFGLTGLNGAAGWGRDGRPREMALRWEQGHVLQIPLGAAQILAEIAAGTDPEAQAGAAGGVTRLRLRESARVGVLDGELRLEDLMLEYAGGGIRRWQVDGILTPVSMRRLTRALDWPEFAGKLSGVIPDVRYADGELSVGGMLLVRVFDGEITLRNLRLKQPFSVVPRLWVDAQVNAIDLETLTRTFSFGRIEGRLDGRVEDLYMESWQPVRFDAAFATPPGDTSRHRISQKAVDHISSIGGGGVSGALSRTMLRFFEDFPYDRLGISCRLLDGTCEMSGVAPAGNGYYIVKSRLLPPRLDVIGYADRVDWDSLIAQLVAVTRQQGAEQ
jgi:hypothetical protein